MDLEKIVIITQPSRLIIKNRKKENLVIQLDHELTMTFEKTVINSTGSEQLCEGVIGIIKILRSFYLIIITRAELVALINSHSIYKVISIDFVQLTLSDPIEWNEEKQLLLANVSKVIEDGFYFSDTFDWSNNWSNQNQIKNHLKDMSYNIIIESNPIFWANTKFISRFVQVDLTNLFVTNCIYGHVGKMSTLCQGKKNLDLIVISRRGNFGIEHFKKGLDKYGNTADLIENEIICIIDNDVSSEKQHKNVFSYVYLTGNVPWYYTDYTKENSVKANKAIKAYNSYCQTWWDEYNLVTFINIHNSEDKRESTLNERLKEMINKESKNNLDIKYYSFETKDTKFNRIDNYINDKSDLLNLLGFHASVYKSKKQLKNEQNGVLNITAFNQVMLQKFQIHLIWKYMNTFLKVLNKAQFTTLIEPTELTKQFKAMLEGKFMELRRQYHPQRDLPEKRARLYQRTLEIMFNSLQKVKSKQYHLNYFKEVFSNKSIINIHISTWNTGATDIRKYLKMIDLDQLLLPQGKFCTLYPEIYCVGWQEAVEWSTMNVISKTKETQDCWYTWYDKILNTINSRIKDGINQYTKLCVMDWVGIMFFMFVREDKKQYINAVNCQIIKTGMGGATGNKGTCMVSFKYLSTTIAIGCSHWAAGWSKNANRISEINEVLNFKFYPESQPISNQMFAPEIKRENTLWKPTHYEITDLTIDTNGSIPELSFQDHDIWFLFGDWNFRIDTDYENSIEYINNNDWKHWVEFDQWYKSKYAYLNLRENIDENVLNHQPSYKFTWGNNKYDREKKRIPSWCDRILFKKYEDKKNVIKYIFNWDYNIVMSGCFSTSDHRPVYGLFEVMVMEDISEKKEEFEHEIQGNIEMKISSEYMKKKLLEFK